MEEINSIIWHLLKLKFKKNLISHDALIKTVFNPFHSITMNDVAYLWKKRGNT